jgi:hypothetical protein
MLLTQATNGVKTKNTYRLASPYCSQNVHIPLLFRLRMFHLCYMLQIRGRLDLGQYQGHVYIKVITQYCQAGMLLSKLLLATLLTKKRERNRP